MKAITQGQQVNSSPKIGRHFREFVEGITKNPNEKKRWAYLALTGNLETPFRDGFAYYLHKELGKDFLVGRDFHASHLGWIGRGTGPVSGAEIDLIKKGERVFTCVLELRAGHLSDAVSAKGNSMISQLSKNVVMYKRVARRAYGILLITDIPYQNDPSLLYRLPTTTKGMALFRRDALRMEKSGLSKREWRGRFFKNLGCSLRQNHLAPLCVFTISLKFGRIEFSLTGYLLRYGQACMGKSYRGHVQKRVQTAFKRAFIMLRHGKQT